MKTLSRYPQLNASSHDEIKALIETLASQLSGHGVTYMTGKLTYGNLLNGLILELSELSEADRLAVGRHVIERLEDWTLERSSTSPAVRHVRKPSEPVRGLGAISIETKDPAPGNNPRAAAVEAPGRIVRARKR